MNVRCTARPCPVILNATCVYYAGENLIYTGINTNDNLEIALQKIDEVIGIIEGNVNPIVLTTVGNSGPATLVGNTLNIPVYTGAQDLQSVLNTGDTANDNDIFLQNGSFLSIDVANNVSATYSTLGFGSSDGVTGVALERKGFTTYANTYVVQFPENVAAGLHNLPLSVNGNYADATGDITIPTGGGGVFIGTL